MREWFEERRAEGGRWPEHAFREEVLLREKLVELGARAEEIETRFEGGRVIAEVEGLRFVSAYSDPLLRRKQFDGKPEQGAVALVWRCGDCGFERVGRLITTAAELGCEIDNTPLRTSHLCRRSLSLRL